ncbi:UNVERIFIED_CONTAM: hypothetical protein RMT77_019748 [Armadillidium vulgare]
MAISSKNIFIIFSIGLILGVDLTSAVGYCDSFSECVLTQSCTNSLGNPTIPSDPEIERAYAGLCKAFTCADAINAAVGVISDDSTVLPECANLPATGTISDFCIIVLLDVLDQIVIPSYPFWLRISVLNYYSTICHVVLCLNSKSKSGKSSPSFQVLPHVTQLNV